MSTRRALIVFVFAFAVLVVVVWWRSRTLPLDDAESRRQHLEEDAHLFARRAKCRKTFHEARVGCDDHCRKFIPAERLDQCLSECERELRYELSTCP